MAAGSDRVVTVFSAEPAFSVTVSFGIRLHDFSVRVASRHPDRGHAPFPLGDSQLRLVKANVHDERSVAGALADAHGAVITVSLYVEQGRETFHCVHVESAKRVAAQANGRVGLTSHLADVIRKSQIPARMKQ